MVVEGVAGRREKGLAAVEAAVVEAIESRCSQVLHYSGMELLVRLLLLGFRGFE